MICNSLKNNSTITSLNISCPDPHKNQLEKKGFIKTDDNFVQTGNEIGDDGCVIIGDLLTSNTTLTELNLDSFFFLNHNNR